MKLYHGTNGAWLDNILHVGLEPRGKRLARNNWKHVLHQSNPNCVYMTDSYAPYFAFNACRGDNPQCAVVEIDTDKLNPALFLPDEDCWEQLGRKRDGLEGSMSYRTLRYRQKLEEAIKSSDAEARSFLTMFTAPDNVTGWQLSLRALGTCCYRGKIPSEAITRAVGWPHRENAWMMFVWDPSITILNQSIMGSLYKVLTAKLFGDSSPLYDTLDEHYKKSVDSFSTANIKNMRFVS